MEMYTGMKSDSQLNINVKNVEHFTMTIEERFELMWKHYHLQVDENRAVSRSLDDIRKHSLSVHELVHKVNKMSFMTGIIMSSLFTLKTNFGVSMAGEQFLEELIQRMTSFIEEEIYQNDKV